MKNQPVLDLPASTLERMLDAAALLFAGGALLLAFSQFSSLPEQIPTHFNIQGEIDGYGSKTFIFLLPVLGLATAIGLIFLTKHPHKFNYLTKITTENAAHEYGRMRLMLRVVNALTCLLFLVITWEILSAADGKSTPLGFLFWVVFIALLIAPPMMLLGGQRSKGK